MKVIFCLAIIALAISPLLSKPKRQLQPVLDADGCNWRRGEGWCANLGKCAEDCNAAPTPPKPKKDWIDERGCNRTKKQRWCKYTQSCRHKRSCKNPNKKPSRPITWGGIENVPDSNGCLFRKGETWCSALNKCVTGGCPKTAKKVNRRRQRGGNKRGRKNRKSN